MLCSFPRLIFWIFPLGTRLDQRPRCSLPVISIIWVLLTLSLARIHTLFGKLILCHHASAHLPSNLFVYQSFNIHVTHLPSNLLFTSIVWVLLPLLLVGIHIPFGMLLFHHHTSARLPLNLLIVLHPHDISAHLIILYFFPPHIMMDITTNHHLMVLLPMLYRWHYYRYGGLWSLTHNLTNVRKSCLASQTYCSCDRHPASKRYCSAAKNALQIIWKPTYEILITNRVLRGRRGFSQRLVYLLKTRTLPL
jgi:hypothetical protein